MAGPFRYSDIDNIPEELIKVEFEKDNDSNGQIDLIHSMCGLRALNYSLIPVYY